MGLLIVLIVLALCSGIRAVRDPLMASYSNVAWFVRGIIINSFEATFYPWKDIKPENFSGLAKDAELEVLIKENSDLKAMLGRKPSEKVVLSRVLVKPPQAPFDEVVLDTGVENGVGTGSQVYDDKGNLIGTVLSSTNFTSKAKFFSSPGTSVEAEVFKKSAVLSLLGQGNGSFTVQVPRDFDIQKGDIFVYPGLRERPIAVVVEVKSDEEDSFKSVFAQGFFDPKTITWVFVESREQTR